MQNQTQVFKTCPRCGQLEPIAQPQCTKCGYFFQTQVMPPGHQLPYQAPVYFVPQHSRPDSTKLVIALLLWFFLGTLGAHRLFLGHVGTGLTLLFLTLFGGVTFYFCIGIPVLAGVGLWLLVDLILILTGSLRPTDGSRLV